MNHRLERVRAILDDQQLDALLVTNAANRRYVSGFTGSAGALLITEKQAILLSDFRYQAQGQREAPNFEFRLMPGGAPLPKQIPTLVRDLAIRKLGFESADVTVADFGSWQDELRESQTEVELVPTKALVDRLRYIKDSTEIALLRRAVAVTDEAFAAIRPLLRPEMRERDVAWELEKAMREGGADGVAFDIIVAGGDNGSRPHARAGDAQLGRGQPIVMDFGALVDGYHADMTRTVILGEADEQFWYVYNTVLAAQQAAESQIRAGTSGRDADTIARDVIVAAGHGDAFGHSLGHGVGLIIHEGPRLAQTSDDALPVGAVFSIEPGIYLPGWGGVRIEDLALLTDTGLDVLTQSSKDPVVHI